jgi:PHYB activation tagged suppressor 1
VFDALVRLCGGRARWRGGSGRGCARAPYSFFDGNLGDIRRFRAAGAGIRLDVADQQPVRLAGS